MIGRFAGGLGGGRGLFSAELLVDDFVDEAPVGLATEFGHEGAHDFAFVLGAGGAELGDAGLDFRGDVVAGELRGEVALEDGEFGLFLVDEVLAAALLKLVDGFVALFDLFLEEGGEGGLVERTALFDFGVLDGGFDEAEGVAPEGVAGFHGGVEVVTNAGVEVGHEGSLGGV
jgi:hypothetical protein